jgi:hypothetical protein
MSGSGGSDAGTLPIALMALRLYQLSQRRLKRQQAVKEAAAKDAAAKEAAAKEAAAKAIEASPAAEEAEAATVEAGASGEVAAVKGAIAAEEAPPGQSRIMTVTAILKAIVYSVLLVAYLILEVLVAMLAYMYLNLYQIQTFGYLISLSHRLLNEFAVQLEKLSPAIANQAYATILGELGAKSILLLFIGLAVSTGIRFLIWIMNEAFDWLHPKKKPAPHHAPAPQAAA